MLRVLIRITWGNACYEHHNMFLWRNIKKKKEKKSENNFAVSEPKPSAYRYSSKSPCKVSST